MIVIVAPYYAPAFKAGGPVKSLLGISKMLSDHGFQLRVISRDQDIDGSALADDLKQKHVTYTNSVNKAVYKEQFAEAKVIWVNTLYSIPFGFKAILQGRKCKDATLMISPRGQLLSGSVNPVKKIYLRVLKFLLNQSKARVVFHYSNPQEQERSISIFNKFPTVIFNNPVSSSLNKPQPPEENSSLVVGVFGRVSPIKNIEFLIALLPGLPANTKLEINGAKEDKEYLEKLNQLAERLGVSHQISFLGMYNKDTFAQKINKVSLVAIPSFSENFCHVFFEAIESGKLVVGSDGLPWQAANKNVEATILPLQQQPWQDRLNKIAQLSTADYQAQQLQLQEFYHEVSREVKQQLIDTFNDLLQP